ncbi:MAG TPA: polysaccharide lyase [Flavisolibacter sp.]|nr:polysaccharide lyase [Flavisolibacter sp.]
MLGQVNHTPKGKRMLSALVLSAVLLSCSKEGFNDEAQMDEASQEPLIGADVKAATSGLPANIIYREDFESGTPFSDYVTARQFVASHSITAITSPRFAGARSGRIELRESDPQNNNGTRAEVEFPGQSVQNRWYVFSAYFPSDGFAADASDELISQWHQRQHGYSSPMSLRIKNDRMNLSIVSNRGKTVVRHDLGVVPKNQWITYAFHIKHSSGSDGLIELWMNGTKKLNLTGPNTYALSSDPELQNPRWKLGLYKSDWNGSTTTGSSKRIIYFDNVIIGNEKATLAQLTGSAASGSTGGSTDGSTGGSTTPTTPTTPTVPTSPTTPTSGSPITSFTLVNSGTERDVLTIKNGQTISLSQLRAYKLNIRANTNSSAVQSIKLELSGAQRKTHVDNAFPYALHGDDGHGNYYYGNWYPPAKGKYTLKATPYSGDRATGTAGVPSTITFTII